MLASLAATGILLVLATCAGCRTAQLCAYVCCYLLISFAGCWLLAHSLRHGCSMLSSTWHLSRLFWWHRADGKHWLSVVILAAAAGNFEHEHRSTMALIGISEVQCKRVLSLTKSHDMTDQPRAPHQPSRHSCVRFHCCTVQPLQTNTGELSEATGHPIPTPHTLS